jgi:hypothetical protein
VVLHLPDVAQLVADEVVARELRRLAEQDRVPRGVAVEAPEPREAEECRPHEDADMLDLHRQWVKRQPIETGFRPFECTSGLRVFTHLSTILPWKTPVPRP